MYKHILIPTDGSPLSSRAVEQSLTFAGEIGAKVTVLTVIEPFHVFTTHTEQLSETRAIYERQAKEHSARHLAEIEDRAGALGVEAATLSVESDDPHQTIIDTAARTGADLVAMASHGRRGISALVLGSVTLKVLTHSTIPVLVYRYSGLE